MSQGTEAMTPRMPITELRNYLTVVDEPDAFYTGATELPPPTIELRRTIRQRIRERINQRVDDLEVEVTNRGVVLSGRCDTFHTKQLAQHAAQAVLDDQRLENRIEVTTPK